MKNIKIALIIFLIIVGFIGSLRIYTMWSTAWKCDSIAVCSCEKLEASGYFLDKCKEPSK